VPRELTFDLLLHRQNFWQVRLLLVYLFVPAKKLVTFFCHSGLAQWSYPELTLIT
jgi:hypothetical protein